MAHYYPLIIIILIILLSSPSTTSDIICDGNTANCSCPSTGDCNLHCHGTNCQAITITCPINGDCHIECTDNQSCKNAIINGTDTSSLHIICSSTSACMNLTIYCPPNTNGDKHCLLKGESGNINKDIQIYAMYGWNDIVINTMNTSWTANNGGSMYCGNEYEFNCILDEWNCSNRNDICINPTTSNPTTTTKESSPSIAQISTSSKNQTEDLVVIFNLVFCVLMVMIAGMIFVVCIRRLKRIERKRNSVVDLDIVPDLERIQSVSDIDTIASDDGYKFIKGKTIKAMNHDIADLYTNDLRMNEKFPERPKPNDYSIRIVETNGNNISKSSNSEENHLLTPASLDVANDDQDNFVFNVRNDDNKYDHDDMDINDYKEVEVEVDVTEGVPNADIPVINDVNEMIIDDVNEFLTQIEKWLNSLNLGKYTEIFIANGFISTQLIKGIDDKNELRKIGISDEQDLDALMIGIQELNNNF